MQPVPRQLATITAKTEKGSTIWLNLKMTYSPFLGTRYICGAEVLFVGHRQPTPSPSVSGQQ
jgi:hypothetical protein